MKRSVAPLLLAALLCLPCVLPVIAAVVGVAALSALGGWLASNALLIAFGSSAAAMGAALLAYVMIARRRRPACEPDAHFGREREVSAR